MDDTTPGTGRKALAINLDRVSYGSFAEIGGGQEVARWFFEVGGAAGTVAKTISAYEAGDEAWEALVPPAVADTIKTRQLFGYQAVPAARQEHPRPSS